MIVSMLTDALDTAVASPKNLSTVGLIFVDMLSTAAAIFSRLRLRFDILIVYKLISAIRPAILSRSSSLSLMYFMASLTSVGSYLFSSPPAPKILAILLIRLFTGLRISLTTPVNASMTSATPSNVSSITSDNPSRLSFTVSPTSSITSATPLRTSDTPWSTLSNASPTLVMISSTSPNTSTNVSPTCLTSFVMVSITGAIC